MKNEGLPRSSVEVEEIEGRERGGGSCPSSSTSRLCTCRCRVTATIFVQAKS